ncbi:MAG: glycosyltransferase family 39 protein [Clostridium sp.]|nr:glycosyltransferase family 39 protein [Clostridium sp.]
MKRLWEKQGKKNIESVLFLLLLLFMAVYYGWRLFALTPWYDELYTYYYFISRGPLYAAIHWPLPNNHVGYSVLSAFFDLFGNAAVGLRGVSWICSLISLYLLFAIGKKCFPKGFALILPLLYIPIELVNQLAVQGRGYALASCLYLTAIYELIRIIVLQENSKKNYIILACALIWALYTLPSSVYFVVPLCIIGGSFLLIKKRKKEFCRLFITACVSAVCTIGLYAVIWLAIGSNLLSKIPDGPFYTAGHIDIILHAPFKSLRTGIQYMLDTPYIQSVGREGYLFRFEEWIKTLFECYLTGLSTPLLIIAGIGLVCIAAVLTRKKGGFLEWYLLLSFILTPLMLIIQAALPYYRVFSFFAVPVVMLFTWLAARVISFIGKPVLILGVNVFAVCLCLALLLMPSYSAQYGGREAAVEDAYEHMSLENGRKVCVTDCDQEYLMKYLFDTEDVLRTIEGADYVLLDKELLLSENTQISAGTLAADAWKLYLTRDEIDRDYLAEKMRICYENDRFALYERALY